jgi:peptidoglycan/LPS O-acetylase OafA/YrhL
VRFLAALWVVVHHSVLWTKQLHTDTWLGRFERYGFVAVSFFFVLSGYILAHVYLNSEDGFDKRKFLISRFARIYPLLLLSLLLDVPLYFYRYALDHGKHHIFQAAFKSMFSFVLLQAWFGSKLLALNPPSWSLSAEAFFYLCFPLLGLALSRWSKRTGWLSIALLWSLAMAVPLAVTLLYPALHDQVDASQLQWFIVLNPLLRMGEFLVGIALCAVQKNFAPKSSTLHRNRYGYLALVSALGLFVLTIDQSNRIPYMMMSNGFLIPVWALLIFALVNIDRGLTVLLSHRYAVILGESSYALYLLHGTIFAYLVHILHVTNMFWIILFPVLIACSACSLFYVERPARTFILHYARVKPIVPQEQEQIALIMHMHLQTRNHENSTKEL